MPIKMKTILLTFSLGICGMLSAQNWQFFIDSIPTLSSPRACDLNNDGVKDIVFGGGTDGVYSNNGIMAVNGHDGTLLWKRPARNEVFGSALFLDITNDGIKDVFMVGRQAQLLAINGQNGSLIWDYFPYNVNPRNQRRCRKPCWRTPGTRQQRRHRRRPRRAAKAELCHTQRRSSRARLGTSTRTARKRRRPSTASTW